jgi:hypothetical protein
LAFVGLIFRWREKKISEKKFGVFPGLSVENREPLCTKIVYYCFTPELALIKSKASRPFGNCASPSELRAFKPTSPESPATKQATSSSKSSGFGALAEE